MSKDKVSYWITIPGFIVAVISLLISILAGIGNRFELWYFRTGLMVIAISAYVGIAGIIISLIGIIAVLLVKVKKGLIYPVLGLVISLLVAGGPWTMMQIVKKVPPIHDITTDTANPPQFVAVLPLRKNAVNPPEYGGEATAVQQEKAYPDIKPLILIIPVDQAFDKALKTVQKKNWNIVATNRDEGRIEATATTFWMGFKDDIVIRISAKDSGSLFDIRSESRVGKGDFGTNAKRVRKFLKEMQK